MRGASAPPDGLPPAAKRAKSAPIQLSKFSGCQWSLPGDIPADCVDIEMWHKAWECIPGVRKVTIVGEGGELNRESLFSEAHAATVAVQGGAHRELDPHGLYIYFGEGENRKISSGLTRRCDTISVYTLLPPASVGPRLAYEMFTEAVRAFEQIARVTAKAVAKSIQPRCEDQWVAATRPNLSIEYEV